jgi:hypothetical protein
MAVAPGTVTRAPVAVSGVAIVVDCTAIIVVAIVGAQVAVVVSANRLNMRPYATILEVWPISMPVVIIGTAVGIVARVTHAV